LPETYFGHKIHHFSVSEKKVQRQI